MKPADCMMHVSKLFLIRTLNDFCSTRKEYDSTTEWQAVGWSEGLKALLDNVGRKGQNRRADQMR